MKKKTGFLLADNQGNGVIAESMAALKKAGFEEEECTVFVNKMLECVSKMPEAQFRRLCLHFCVDYP